jgi:hyperosmotically inducible periplasmic protein
MSAYKLLGSALAASLLLMGSAVAAPADPPKTPEPAARGDAAREDLSSTDAALASKVKTALVDNETTKARQIDVEVYKGQVQLNGFVDSAEQKTVAGQVAGQVAGAMNVKNNLSVKTTERTAGQTVNDGMITAKVKAALIGDSRTKAHQIEVNTREGIVQLGGFVDTSAAKTAAAEVAGSIDGVKSVQNRLNIRN